MRSRAEWRDIPVLVVTAKDLTAEERSRLNGDVERVLQKGSSELDEMLDEIHKRIVARLASGRLRLTPGVPCNLKIVDLFDSSEQMSLSSGDPGGPPSRESSTPAVNNPYGLSPREREVLAFLVDGRTNREIGEALFISEKTASVHVTHILDKLGVNSRGAAAAAAVRGGLELDAHST
jgi:DNA-binding NarL/FixJ family response regulator